MDQETKQKSIILAQSIQEAMETLNVALSGSADEGEVIEAKNIVAGVLRSYKNFLADLPDPAKTEAQQIFAKKIEALATRAKQLL